MASIELSDIEDSHSLKTRTLYVCAECGTVACTNSGKHLSSEWRANEEGQPTRSELSDDDHPLFGKASVKNAVRLVPECPCGNDLFNPTTVLAIHHEEEGTHHARRGR